MVRSDPRPAYLARARAAMRAAAGQGCRLPAVAANCHPRRARTHRRLRIGLWCARSSDTTHSPYFSV